jgi:hypothetical protein
MQGGKLGLPDHDAASSRKRRRPKAEARQRRGPLRPALDIPHGCPNPFGRCVDFGFNLAELIKTLGLPVRLKSFERRGDL